jgi:hypothetical protein
MLVLPPLLSLLSPPMLMSPDEQLWVTVSLVWLLPLLEWSAIAGAAKTTIITAARTATVANNNHWREGRVSFSENNLGTSFAKGGVITPAVW